VTKGQRIKHGTGKKGGKKEEILTQKGGGKLRARGGDWEGRGGKRRAASDGKECLP